jgi:hypothetical protein
MHQAAIYGSDDGFLAVAAPFARGGIAAGEPVFAVASPAKLELLGGELGADAARVDQMDSAVFYDHRPPQRVTVLEKYARHHGDGGRVRVLAEPGWADWTDAEVRDWQRMEAGLNVLLDGTGIWAICPYDTRQAPEPIIDSARRTHPALVEGTGTRQSADYTDPAKYAVGLDGPLPPVPRGAALLPPTIRLREIRRFAASQAAAYLGPGTASLMTVAIQETAGYLKKATGSPVATRIWQQQAGAITCDLRADGPATAGAFDGYLMPDLSQPRPDDGLWYARQFTTRLDLRTSASGIQARLQLQGSR